MVSPGACSAASSSAFELESEIRSISGSRSGAGSASSRSSSSSFSGGRSRSWPRMGKAFSAAADEGVALDSKFGSSRKENSLPI